MKRRIPLGARDLTQAFDQPFCECGTVDVLARSSTSSARDRTGGCRRRGDDLPGRVLGNHAEVVN